MLGNTTLHEALKEHQFTAGLAEPQISRLAGVAREVRFAENELILRACEQSKHFYLLLSGSVCVEARMRAYTVRVQELAPGAAFGWSALLDQHDTLFQVRSREASMALCLDGAALAEVFREDAELAAEMLRRALKLVAGRVEATEARLAEFCGMRVGAL
jgi:CRP-like cAMP-binding protein